MTSLEEDIAAALRQSGGRTTSSCSKLDRLNPDVKVGHLRDQERSDILRTLGWTTFPRGGIAQVDALLASLTTDTITSDSFHD